MLPWKLHFLIVLSSIIFIFKSTVSSTNSTQQQDVLYDIYPFIRVYKNGTVQRFIGTGYSPPSLHDPNTGVQSKDVVVSTALNVKARLYLPQGTKPGQKLPLLIYYHGGGFFTESAFSPTYHNHLSRLVSEAKVLAVSVNYRLAPEHLLPTAYQDSWLALKWALSHHHSKGNGHDEPWLGDFADFDRVYLGGDSAGANIAHHMSIRIGSGNADWGIGFKGMFLNCPYFLGRKSIGGENESSNAYVETQLKRLWLYGYPRSSGLDDPLVNPGMDRGVKRVGCKRILVYVAGNDVLRFRGWYYKSVMERSGWDGNVKVVEVKGEGHVFNLLQPNSVDAVAMLKSLAAFLNNH